MYSKHNVGCACQWRGANSGGVPRTSHSNEWMWLQTICRLQVRRNMGAVTTDSWSTGCAIHAWESVCGCMPVMRHFLTTPRRSTPQADRPPQLKGQGGQPSLALLNPSTSKRRQVGRVTGLPTLTRRWTWQALSTKGTQSRHSPQCNYQVSTSPRIMCLQGHILLLARDVISIKYIVLAVLEIAHLIHTRWVGTLGPRRGIGRDLKGPLQAGFRY